MALNCLLTLFQLYFWDSLSSSHHSKYFNAHNPNLMGHRHLTCLLQLIKLENINPPTDTAGTCRGKSHFCLYYYRAFLPFFLMTE